MQADRTIYRVTIDGGHWYDEPLYTTDIAAVAEALEDTAERHHEDAAAGFATPTVSVCEIGYFDLLRSAVAVGLSTDAYYTTNELCVVASNK